MWYRKIEDKLRTYALPVLLVLLLLDLGFSFLQYYNSTLDGDMANLILSDIGYTKVMEHPFGTPVLLNGESYPATNRFFAHLTMMVYFQNVPIWLQSFVSPIESVYIACGMIKLFTHVLLLWLISYAATGHSNPLRKDNLLVAVLVTPIFQAFGYTMLMGIIDPSVTYTVFYSLSIGLVGLFLIPFFQYHFRGKACISFPRAILLGILAFILPFFGPLNCAVLLVICPSFLFLAALKNFWEYKGKEGVAKSLMNSVPRIHGKTLFLFILISLTSLYSLYIGSYNYENTWGSDVTLLERFSKLPVGFDKQFINFQYLFLIGVILVNSLLIQFQGTAEGKRRWFKLLTWVGVFAAVYIILLPFGGYRDYRPFILRRDTVLPITLMVTFLFGYSSYWVLHLFQFRIKPLYYLLIGFTVYLYTSWDEPEFDSNDCEREGLRTISNSKKEVVHLGSNCTVMNWYPLNKDPENTRPQAHALYMWNIIDNKDKRYYH